jgi:hypothetical protein
MSKFQIGLNRASFVVDNDDDLEIQFEHFCGSDAYAYLNKAEAEQLYAFLAKWLHPTQETGSEESK